MVNIATKEYTVFAQGWLENETARGRPVDVLQMPDGALLVSDDLAGVIYRIEYTPVTENKGVLQYNSGKRTGRLPGVEGNTFVNVSGRRSDAPAGSQVPGVLFDVLRQKGQVRF